MFEIEIFSTQKSLSFRKFKIFIHPNILTITQAAGYTKEFPKSN